MSTATFFNPTNSSLEAKIKAAKGILQSVQMLEASQQHIQANGPDSALGTEEELSTANTLTCNSFNDMVNALSLLELQQAHTEKLLSLDEYNLLMTEKQKANLQEAHRAQLSYESTHSKDRNR